jgi:peptidyl-prolyl cis-trans isomerase C
MLYFAASSKLKVSFVKKIKGCFLLGLVLLVMMGHHTFANDLEVLGLVNGQKIYVQQLDDWLKNTPNQNTQDLLILRQLILNEIVSRTLILQDAKKILLEERPENHFKYQIAKENLVIELWFENYFKNNPLTESDIEQEYKLQKSTTEPGEINAKQYKFSQIIVKSEPEAKEIIQKLLSRADFAQLAQTKSLDEASSKQGGQVDWLLLSQLQKSVIPVIRGLKVGEITSKPTKTQFGWHVFRLDELRDYEMPSFETVKQGIFQSLVQVRRQEAVENLLKNARIEQPKR